MRAKILPLCAATAALLGCGGDDTVAAYPDGGADATTVIDSGPHPGPDGSASDGAVGIDAAAPRATVSATSIDFGLAPCGGAAATDQSITVTNAGGAPLDVTASLASGAAFAITSPATTTIAPGASAAITIAPQPIAATATAGLAIADTLLLATNDPSQASLSVGLSITPQGATLALAAGATFGDTPLGATSPASPLTLANTGNAPITFTIGAPSDAEFALTYGGSSGTITLAPQATVPALQATFAPTQPGPIAASAPIVLASGSATCGQGATSIALSGTGATGGASVSASQLDFGPVACGTTAPQQLVTVANTGVALFSIASATLGRGAASPFVVSFADTTIAPGGSATVTVTPSAIPVTSAVPGDYGDTLTITTTLPNDPPHVVALREAASGAVLSVDTPALAFGGVPLGTSKAASFTLTNSGDRAATITLSPPSLPFSVAPGTSFTLGPGAPQTATVTYAPTQASPSSGDVAIAIDPITVVCQPPPASIALSGTGESGAVAVSAASLTFGPTACGQAALAKSFTIQNTGNAPLAWSASLGSASSPYTIAPASAKIAPGATSTVTVTPKAIPTTASLASDAFADTVTITSDVPGDAPHVVALHQSATGAILAFSPGSIHFGAVPVGTTTSGGFQIVNSGNAAASVSLASSNGSFVVPAATSIGASASASLSASFAPGQSTATQTSNVTMSVSPSTALCAPLPSPLALDGTGSKGVVKLSTAALDFKNVSCGTAGAAQQVVVTNSGNQDFTITGASLGLGASSHFTVAMSPASGLVPKNGGGSVVVTVTPTAIPATSPVGNGIDSDTLTITTSAAGDSPHAVALTMGVQGAIVTSSTSAIAFGNVALGATAKSSLSVTNQGNLPATIDFGSITSSVFAFDQNTVAAAGSSINPNAYFTPAAAQGYSATAAMRVPAGTVLCAALPGTITLGGTGTNASTIAVSPTSLDFLNVSCGAAAPAARGVTVKNTANQAAALSFSLQSGKWYSVTTTPANATSVPANGGTVTLNVAPKAIPVAFTTTTGGAAYADTLVVKAGSTVTNVALAMSAQGAILQFNPASINVARNGGSTNFQVVNSGNAPAGITLSSDSASFVPSPASGGATVGGTSWSVKDDATTAQTAHVSMKLQAGSVVCQPLPASLLVNGQ